MSCQRLQGKASSNEDKTSVACRFSFRNHYSADIFQTLPACAQCEFKYIIQNRYTLNKRLLNYLSIKEIRMVKDARSVHIPL